METQNNPFEAPEAELVDRASHGEAKIPVYSPGQVSAGAFFGGALVGVYFLYRTFKGMKQEASASKTLIGGLIFVGALLVLLPFLPSRFPNYAIPLAYALIAKGIANRFQMKKADIIASDQYELVSNWRVIAELLVGLIVFIVLISIEMIAILYLRGRI